MMPSGFRPGSTPGSIRDPLFDYDFTRPPAVGVPVQTEPLIGVPREVVAGTSFGRRRKCGSVKRKSVKRKSVKRKTARRKY
jgi:hypothetical protein